MKKIKHILRICVNHDLISRVEGRVEKEEIK